MCKRLIFLSCLALMLSLVGSNAFGAVLDLKITAGTNDAEEHLTAVSHAAGEMDVGSTDLELPYEDDGTPSATDLQLIGLRYNVALAKGAKINKAYVEFTCDEVKGGTKPVNLIIEGQLAVNPPAFASTAKDLSGRAPWTKAQVKWTVENWTTVGQKSQTPDLTAILQELMAQGGWASGNAVVLAFRADPNKPSTGLRCADAYEKSTTTCPVLRLEIFSPEAKDPNPANGAQEVTSPLLQWTAGDGAVFHQVYLGTKPQLTDADKAGVPSPAPMYFHVAGLTPGTTYYWRVDETAADGTVTAGPVWSFTSMYVTAWSPSPADWGVWMRNDTTISWKAGSGAVSHKVYGGTDKAAVTAGAASVLLATQAGTSFTLGKLTPLTVYYWRVDEVDATGKVVPGPVWTINVVGANTGSWRTAAAATAPGFLRTYVADGLYDIGTFGGEMTYEFIVRGNPDEKEVSQCLIGRRQFGTTTVGLKYEQWNNTKTYGATVFGVADYDYKVPTAPGEYTHLVFVSSKAAKKTDLYVNGVLKGSVATDITLSGKVGIGYGAQGADGSGSFDNFDGSIFGVAIYDKALSVTEIAANSVAFLVGGPEAVTIDIPIAAAADDVEEKTADNSVTQNSDLEMPFESAGTTKGTTPQVIGLRYAVPVAKGTQITKASVEFTCDENKGGTQVVNLVIDGQLVANAPAFGTAAKDLTGRTPRTKTQVKWAVENWTTVGQKSKTPDLVALLTEITSQDGWTSGNSLVLLFTDDASNPSAGVRCADSKEDQDGNAGTAPVLRIEVLIPWTQ
jgi:hypothetical protein